MIEQRVVKSGRATMSIEIFDSAHELAKANRERPIRPGENDTIRYGDGDGDWAGCKTYEEAENLLSNGWSYKLEKVKADIKGVMLRETGKRITTKNDVVGFAPIVPLAIQGVPQCMVNTAYKPIKSKVIDLYYDIAVNARVSSKDIFENGLKVMQAVVSLERQGYRVRMSALQSYAGNRDGYHDCDMLVVRVKNENQPLDMKRIMFPFMHPAMFRKIGFAWQERSPMAHHRWGKGRDFNRVFSKDNIPQMIRDAFGPTAIRLSNLEILNQGVEYIEKMLKGEIKK